MLIASHLHFIPNVRVAAFGFWPFSLCFSHTDFHLLAIVRCNTSGLLIIALCVVSCMCVCMGMHAYWSCWSLEVRLHAFICIHTYIHIACHTALRLSELNRCSGNISISGQYMYTYVHTYVYTRLSKEMYEHEIIVAVKNITSGKKYALRTSIKIMTFN